MRIGVLKERKKREGRVALTPEQARFLVSEGHEVWIESYAGQISGFTDKAYRSQGAKIIASPVTLLKNAELILKVKEPLPRELFYLSPDQILFCFMHLASQPDLLKIILKKKLTALAYETLELPDKSLPLLKPMSEIAGKLSVQNGAEFLKADRQGKGLLLGGTENVSPGRVLILGAGTVGFNAAKIATGLGAQTTVVDKNADRLREVKNLLPAVEVLTLNDADLNKLVAATDLLVGAILISGARTPKLITKKMVRSMQRGSVIVDVSVDQGGCVETSEVTTHENPIVIKHGVLHYGVSNMPGSVPFTSTKALTEATFPYIQKIANLGLNASIKKYPEIGFALNCLDGRITHPGLASIKRSSRK